jgi:maltooligosyltrehalose synthase
VVAGPDRDRIIAFARRAGRTRIIVAAARHCAPLTDAGRHWPERFDATLKLDPAGLADGLGSAGEGWRSLELSRLFATLPVAVLR